MPSRIATHGSHLDDRSPHLWVTRPFMVQGSEVHPQPSHREKRVRLDGGNWKPASLRDLRLRQPVEIHPFDDLPLVLRQGLEHVLSLAPFPRALRHVRGLVRRVMENPGLRGNHLVLGSTSEQPISTHGIDSPLMHDPHQPGGHGAVLRDGHLRGTPHRRECLLDDLLGPSGMLHDTDREGVCQGSVAPDQLLQFLLMPHAGCARSSRWSAHLRPPRSDLGADRASASLAALDAQASMVQTTAKRCRSLTTRSSGRS